jgi:hypothetical protein
MNNSLRYVTTRYPVLVDGKEMNELDTVLCLVNTALLSHPIGLYTSKGIITTTTTGTTKLSSFVKRKNGTLTNKTKKILLAALSDADSSVPSSQQQQLFELLCDLNILVALDQILPIDESKLLCHTVQKWARGQKQSTVLPSKFIQTLISILNQY